VLETRPYADPEGGLDVLGESVDGLSYVIAEPFTGNPQRLIVASEQHWHVRLGLDWQQLLEQLATPCGGSLGRRHQLPRFLPLHVSAFRQKTI
jgi:hypothetical protein